MPNLSIANINQAFEKPNAMKSVTHKPRHLPAKSLLALSLLMAYGSGFAGTTITTVPVGTVVTKSGNYFLGPGSADIDTMNVLGAGTQLKNIGAWEWRGGWLSGSNYYMSGDTIVGGSGTGALNIESGG
jgi:hypothetical protein